MKKTHIIFLLLIAVSVASLMTIAADAGTYGDFEKAMNSEGSTQQIIGYLSTDKLVEYDPKKNANQFSFYMKDEKGVEKKVICLRDKPQDFERTENIVLTGKMKGDVFIAHDIQLKCPSKYKDEALQNAKL